MKKLSLLFLMSALIVIGTYSQPRNIGLRLGGNQELTYQQYVGGDYNKFLQLDIGSFYFSGLQGTLSYNFLSNYGNEDGFSVYYGFGAGLGFNWGDNDWYPRFWDKQDPGYENKYLNRTCLRRYWFVGVVGQIALEYKFTEIPLAIALDYRPLVGVEFGKKYFPNNNNPKAGEEGETLNYSRKRKFSYHTPGLWAFALNVKYRF